MNRWLVAAWLVVGLLPSTSSALLIDNIRPSYAPFGATRHDLDFLPGDVLYMSFDIEDLKLDKEGKARYDVKLEMIDAKGKVIFENVSENVIRPQLGGKRMPGKLELFIGLKRAPGKYVVRLTVNDKIAKLAKAFDQPFNVLPESFGFISVSAPAVGFYGQPYIAGVGLAYMGLDPKTKQPSVEVSIKVFDDKGVSVAPPQQTLLPRDLPDGADLEKANFFPVTIPMYLNRAGRFTVEIQAHDKISKQKKELRFPITVLDVNGFTGK